MLEERIQYHDKHFVRLFYEEKEENISKIELFKKCANQAINKNFEFYNIDVGHIYINIDSIEDKSGYDPEKNEIYISNKFNDEILSQNFIYEVSHLFESRICLNKDKKNKNKPTTAWISKGIPAYLWENKGELNIIPEYIPDNFLTNLHNPSNFKGEYTLCKSAFEYLLENYG